MCFCFIQIPTKKYYQKYEVRYKYFDFYKGFAKKHFFKTKMNNSFKIFIPRTTKKLFSNQGQSPGETLKFSILNKIMTLKVAVCAWKPGSLLITRYLSNTSASYT